ncbi:MAG: beta-hydroxyacyl-ACP dehydratase [Bacteroidales bacterium]|nr:beta-hydroxyacyl-ACP dehydratase [Bacteroidales bacterium]
MLQDNLYQLLSFNLSEPQDRLTATVRLNKEHPVFQGHFPGNPILPGVCTIQIIKELIDKGMEAEYMLTKAGNVKYLGFVNPVANPDVLFDLALKGADTGVVTCNATVSAGGNTTCSFKGELTRLVQSV